MHTRELTLSVILLTFIAYETLHSSRRIAYINTRCRESDRRASAKNRDKYPEGSDRERSRRAVLPLQSASGCKAGQVPFICVPVRRILCRGRAQPEKIEVVVLERLADRCVAPNGLTATYHSFVKTSRVGRVSESVTRQINLNEPLGFSSATRALKCTLKPTYQLFYEMGFTIF